MLYAVKTTDLDFGGSHFIQLIVVAFLRAQIRILQRLACLNYVLGYQTQIQSLAVCENLLKDLSNSVPDCLFVTSLENVCHWHSSARTVSSIVICPVVYFLCGKKKKADEVLPSRSPPFLSPTAPKVPTTGSKLTNSQIIWRVQQYSKRWTQDLFFFILKFSSFSRDDVLTWLNDSLLPRLLDDSVLLRDTGSVLLGTLRLRQIRDSQGEPVFTSAETQWQLHVLIY